jgi:hypothetical protein
MAECASDFTLRCVQAGADPGPVPAGSPAAPGQPGSIGVLPTTPRLRAL